MKHNQLKMFTKAAMSLTFVWMVTFSSFGQTKKDQEAIRKSYDNQKIDQLRKDVAKENEEKKQRIERLAKDNGWEIQIEQADGNTIELQDVTENGVPLYYTTYNRGAGVTTRANRLYTGGGLGLSVHGENMIAGVWDGGPVRRTHQLFSSRTTQKDGLVFSSPNANNNHATHVTGTVIGSDQVDGGNSRGMAFKASAWTYDWNNDLFEAINAANDGLLISNHSYGLVTTNLPQYLFGKYTNDSRRWDNLMYDAPYYLMVVAAGNDRRNQAQLTNKNGFDLLTGHSCSKNNIVVAAVRQVTNYTGPNSVLMSNFSNWGPTDDGRIKPDISAKGVNVRSASSNGNSSYASLSGTSMASPNATGTLLLLQQHYNDVNGEFMRSATLRGLALHTADEAGSAPGPDYRFGWGLLNAAKAAQAISDNGSSALISEEVLSNGGIYSRTVASNNIDDLMVTICWTDPSGNVLSNTTDLRTASLINDLDVRVTKGSTNNFPWKLNPGSPASAATKGDNNVDNIEKVEVQNASGLYTITVSHKGSLRSGSQAFSIIVTGISENVTCNATIPTSISTSNITGSRASINWSSVQGATYNARFRAQGTTQWSNVNAQSNSITLSGLIRNTTYEVQVRSNCSQSVSEYSISQVFQTTDQSLTYCTSRSQSSAAEYISLVRLGSINNSSEASNYTDFTDQSSSLTRNTAYTINITPTWTSTTYNEGYAVWIDFNADGDFVDNGEQILTVFPSQSNAIEGSFTVPRTAVLGKTRMRVSMKYNRIPLPCETFQFGEVEDYSIVIENRGTDNIAPSTPIGLNATNIEETSFTLNWDASSDNIGVIEYDIYRGDSKLGTVTTTDASITGLTASSIYEFSVTAKDAAGNTSAKSSALTVQTKGAMLNYCDSKGGSTDEWIDFVSLGDMTNSSGANGGYKDYTDKVANINFGTNTLLISAGFRETAYTEFWKVWIDYNQDGNFSNDELLAQGSSSSANNLSIEFSVPTSALVGATRMRVSMKYNASQTACETFQYGEVEDYTVMISESDNNTNVVLSTNNALGIGNESTSAIQVVPNPVLHSFELRGEINEGTYRVYDFSGIAVQSGSVLKNESIDVSTLKNGIYTFQLNDGQKVFTEKLIIAK